MFRFHLWFLVVAVTILAVWLRDRSDRARAQRQCVVEIHSIGGTVYYDYVSSRGGLPSGASPFPKFLTRVCGEDFLHSVTRVDVPTGAKAIELAELRSVELVVLHGNDVDDQDVLAVAKLPRLRQLKIVSHERFGYDRGTKITDESLELLGQLPTLESVVVEGRHFSPQGIESLFKGPKLKSIKIHGTIWDSFRPIEFPENVRVEFSRPRQPRCSVGSETPVEDETFYIHLGENPAAR